MTTLDDLKCLQNHRDQLAVWVYDRSVLPGYGTRMRYSLTVEITAKFKLGWANLQVYGLSSDEFFSKRLEIEAALIRAWEAL